MHRKTETTRTQFDRRPNEKIILEIKVMSQQKQDNQEKGDKIHSPKKEGSDEVLLEMYSRMRSREIET
jgi:hypothetical protein